MVHLLLRFADLFLFTDPALEERFLDGGELLVGLLLLPPALLNAVLGGLLQLLTYRRQQLVAHRQNLDYKVPYTR